MIQQKQIWGWNFVLECFHFSCDVHTDLEWGTGA